MSNLDIKEILATNWSETEIEKEDVMEILDRLSINEVARLTNILNRAVTNYGQDVITQLELLENKK